MGVLSDLLGRGGEIAKDIDKGVASEAAADRDRANLTDRISRRGSEIAQDIRDNAASDRGRGNYCRR